MSSSPQVVVATPRELADTFASEVVTLSRHRDLLAVALPGGSVAEAFCPALAEAPLDWRRIHLFWCDERAVPPDHPDSNFRIAAERLLSRIEIDPRHVHRMKGEAHDLARAASEYEGEMRSAIGVPPRPDIALLGVGPDGHVCSLFPGHPALAETSSFVVTIADSPKPPPARLTLTLPALAGAFVVVAAFGASKAAVIREALTDPVSTLPVALATRRARESLYLLDPDAAGEQIRFVRGSG